MKSYSYDNGRGGKSLGHAERGQKRFWSSFFTVA